MYLPQYPSSEPLYVLTFHHEDATTLLKAWAAEVKMQTQINENKLKLYTINSLQNFYVTWPHGLDRIKIWDQWNRKHIYVI